MDSKRKINALIGGPSYLMQLDARHCAAMVDLALSLFNSGRCGDLQIGYEHACPVEIARNSIFEKAIQSDATHLIWADSDVYWQGGSDNLVWGCDYLSTTRNPIVVVPVKQRNGVGNIIINSDLERLHGSITVEAVCRPCWGAGMGLAIFNLDWYRQMAIPRGWGKDDDKPWFRSDWMFVGGKGAGKHRFISEDIWHTSRLRKYGVDCLWAPLVMTKHADRGYER